MKTILESPRLLLREMSLEDLDFVAAMLAHPEVMRFWPRCMTRGEAESWVRKQMDRYEKDGYGLWLAAERSTGKPIGQAGLVKVEVEGLEHPAISYLIDRPYWRRGFATEAATAIRDHAFRSLGLAHVITLVRPGHRVSLAVARKAGMKGERMVRFAGLDHLLLSCEPGG